MTSHPMNSFKWEVMSMLEFLLAFSSGGQTSVGLQSYLTTNQIGQINGNNAYGHCLSWNGTKFYVLVGMVGTTNAPVTTKLFVYDIPSNTWSDLGAIPADMGSNIYWSLVPIDNDTLVGICRLDKATYKISTNTWTVLPKVPSGVAAFNKYGIRTHLYGGKVYLVGPNASNSQCTAAVYDPANDTFTNLAASGNICGTYSPTEMYDGKIYIFPATAAAYSKVQIYDIATDTFSYSTVDMPSNAAFSSAHYYNGLIYLLGGSISGVITDRVIAYDIAKDAFTTPKKLLRTNASAMSYIQNGVITMWGGFASGTTTYYTNFLKYQLGDLSTEKVITGTYKAKMTGPTKYAFTAQPINGKIYSFSGYTAPGTMSTSMNVYDISTNTWSVVNGANAPQGRYGYGCCVLNGKYWIFGGRTATTPLDDIHCYDPATNTWTAMGTLPSARYYATAAAYQGNIYVAGGFNGTDQLNELGIYDPVTKTFTSGTNMPDVLHGHNAAVVSDKMYIVGGLSRVALKTTWIYDITANTWSISTDLPVAGAYGATVARGTKLYRYGGGDSSAGKAQAGLLVFDTVTKVWSTVNTGPISRTLLGMVSTYEGLWIYGGYTGASQGELYLIT